MPIIRLEGLSWKARLKFVYLRFLIQLKPHYVACRVFVRQLIAPRCPLCQKKTELIEQGGVSMCHECFRQYGM